MKKYKVLFLVAACSLVALLGINFTINENDICFSTTLNDIEASANNTEGTKTTWNCVGNVGKCYAQCPSCGTVVRGSGDLLGMHSCN